MAKRRQQLRLVQVLGDAPSTASALKRNAALPRLEYVSSGTIRRFEWILRQFKEETRRLSSAKSRVDDAEMAQKPPKLRIREFLRHTLAVVSALSTESNTAFKASIA